MEQINSTKLKLRKYTVALCRCHAVWRSHFALHRFFALRGSNEYFFPHLFSFLEFSFCKLEHYYAQANFSRSSKPEESFFIVEVRGGHRSIIQESNRTENTHCTITKAINKSLA
jgi:hypothetical protein